MSQRERFVSEKKVLIIGSSGHQYVDCIEWGVEELPNIVDYDIVVVNVRSITDDFFESVKNDFFRSLRSLLTRLLISNGTIIVLSDHRRTEERTGRYPHSFNTYSWCPIDIGTRSESGTTIEIIENSFPKYFSQFSKWDYYFFIPQGCLSHEFTDLVGHPNQTKYQLPAKYFIKNRYDQMLSGSYTIEVFYKKTRTRTFGPSYDSFDDAPDNVLGEIMLIPLIQETHHREALNLLLDDLLGKPQCSLPPEWVEKVEMPFIDQFQSEVQDIYTKITSYQDQISSLEKRKTKIESYKRLLYSDGFELENIFRECLEELGGKVEPAKYSDEEYCLVYGDKDYPVEAKGVSKSISLTHLRQLIDYMLKYDEKTGEKGKGILLGNPWKKVPIEQRNTNAKPNFPQNVLSRAQDMNISLLSSVDFFEAFCRFLEDNSIGHKILGKIVSSIGLVDLSKLA